MHTAALASAKRGLVPCSEENNEFRDQIKRVFAGRAARCVNDDKTVRRVFEVYGPKMTAVRAQGMSVGTIRTLGSLRGPENDLFSEEEHQAIFDLEICPVIFSDANSVDCPVAAVSVAPSGACQSAAVDAALIELHARGGAVAIIGAHRRMFHPGCKTLMVADKQTPAAYFGGA